MDTSAPLALRPTEILSFEHRLIEQVLDCLEILSHAARDTGRLDIVAAEDTLDALWTLADRFHHAREEALLYALAERRGLPRAAGPVAAALEDHAELHRALESMQDSVTAARMAAPRAAGAFHRVAEAAIALLRAHILKEDNVLFPLAESLFSDADRAALGLGPAPRTARARSSTPSLALKPKCPRTCSSRRWCAPTVWRGGFMFRWRGSGRARCRCSRATGSRRQRPVSLSATNTA